MAPGPGVLRAGGGGVYLSVLPGFAVYLHLHVVGGDAGAGGAVVAGPTHGESGGAGGGRAAGAGRGRGKGKAGRGAGFVIHWGLEPPMMESACSRNVYSSNFRRRNLLYSLKISWGYFINACIHVTGQDN